MAVSPQIFQDAINAQLKRAEEALDRLLTKAANGSIDYNGTICVDATTLADAAIDALIPKYKQAGWDSVERRSSYSGTITWVNFKFKPNLNIETEVVSPEEVIPDRRKITI